MTKTIQSYSICDARHLQNKADALNKRSLLTGTILSRLGQLGVAAVLSGAMMAAGSGDALGQAGGVIVHPDTNANLTIQATEGGQVLTSNYLIIYTTLTALTAASVGTTIADPTNQGEAVEVISVVVNPTTGLATSMVVRPVVGGANRTVTTYRDASADYEPVSAGSPAGTTLTAPNAAVGDSNLFYSVSRGRTGADGNNGGGIGFLSYPAGDGEPGGSVLVPHTAVAALSHGPVEVISDGVAGVVIGSQGGSGGDGGYTIGIGTVAGRGGAAGSSGNVTGTNYVDVVTGRDPESLAQPACAPRATVNACDPTGAYSHGVHVFSRSGTAGEGGAGIILGFGGAGGSNDTTAGTASGTNYGQVTTWGEGAIGFLVQSVGGSGGEGGRSYGLVSLPGGGSWAGNADNAIGTNYGNILTHGVGAHGMYVQSVGGSGGVGGLGVGLVTLGDSGGAGGDSGAATAINHADNITTHGDYAIGVGAQSVGGGGGDGSTAAGLVALGGDGSTGGEVTPGSLVFVHQGAGRIDTYGRGSHAIFAQSIGGGGGNGGIGGGLVGLGGDGSAAGDGRDVEVQTEAGAQIRTRGEFAYGIFAQSIGGGGGAGAVGAGLIGLGGDGAGGGSAGNVLVVNNAEITTVGREARGLFAQSIGGGGGAAHAAGGLIAVGGSGGGAGNAGANVDVENYSLISTHGIGADAVFAQSIGGGGGAGSPTGGLVAIGGDGGSGGDAGEVDVQNHGNLHTRGDRARGIFAQSIGGGGGSGGDTGGLIAIGGDAAPGGNAVISDGALVYVRNSGAIETEGNVSSAIHAASVGGGGGDGGTTGGVFVTIGGDGAAGGDGGDVRVDHANNLRTSGNDSHGIFAESVGGGGGSGGSTVSVSAIIGVALGGDGDVGGDGGDVRVNFQSRTITLAGAPVEVDPLIETSGDRSRGVFAQSVGGGGGAGGFSVQVALGYIGALSISLGGDGAGGGDGGEVLICEPGTASSVLCSDVNIRTSGEFSEGLLAQSVGGGGGAGGFAISFAGAAGETAAGAISIGLGGDGAGGGSAERVFVDLGGSIATLGDFSTGMIAQSVGGGGGAGGFSVAAGVAAAGVASGSITVGLGGDGGAGGAGRSVDATFDGTISTRGDHSLGAVIQSVGGGGGNAGFNLSVPIGLSSTVAGGIGVGLGGSGGNGGSGGLVTGTIGGLVTTSGDFASGALIQSVGGGGGNGGFNISGSITLAGVAAGGITVGLGGSGGLGGAGGEVIAAASSIATSGDFSNGFVAQSVGGGGGNGNFNVSGNIAIGGTVGGGIAVGLGGSGEAAGSGDVVNATLTGVAATRGDQSTAIFAQSLGGGGGNGGINVSGNLAFSGAVAGAIGVGLGGSGEGGGSSESVTLTVVGSAHTGYVDEFDVRHGDESTAIFVQSLGGGGGNGGINVTGGIVAASTGAGTLGFGLGGSGGDGGNGWTATLALNAGVADDDNTLIAATTAGDRSGAIVVQSLGGGGGNGGLNVAGSLAFGTSFAGNLGVGIGGTGGDGGHSNLAIVPGVPVTYMADADINGDVVTLGNESRAIVIQSVGGGGGNGAVNVTGGISGTTSGLSGNILVGVGGFGSDGGDGGAVIGTINSDIQTGQFAPGTTTTISGDGASGLTIQSLGGSGGIGGVNVTGGISVGLGSGGTGTLGVGIGGFAGGGGSASTVDGTFTGSILTRGDDAYGALLQSVGGGGGAGGVNVTGAVALSAGTTGSIGFGLGGFGGDGGRSDRVTGHLNGNVTTFGNDAFGAMIQSLGGGGGVGAVNVTGTLAASLGGSSNSGALSIGVGGFGGDGSPSGDVVATVNGTYLTHGLRSSGVIAQSVGGGGGNGGVNVSGAIQFGLADGAAGTIGVGGFGGDAASSAGNVNLERNGDTITRGADSIGVLAQSLGGGGGAGGVNASAGISVTLDDGASLGFGLGGFGGDGGSAGNVTANIQGSVISTGVLSDITTDDEPVLITDFGDSYGLLGEGGRRRLGGSHGIVVQSQGGGGGIGGVNVTGQLAIGGDNGRGVSIGIGGFGGDGGDAGSAHLTFGNADNTVFAQGVGDDRAAVIVQSVGGGGGVGGINVSAGITTTGNLIAGIGGFGGDGGLGGAVTADINANLRADGRRARGLLAQSVGGGGGFGAINVSGGINATGSASVSDDPSLVFGLGGFGGDGNRSGNVAVNYSGNVAVTGEDSIGMLVQSVAGGGGDGGINVLGNLALGDGEGFAASIGIGGTGGDGANAGDVTFNSTGNVSVATSEPIDDDTPEFDPRRTSHNAVGVLVQSVGGGGGAGGVNVTAALSRAGQPIAVGVGGSGGSGGDAGAVRVVRGYSDPGAAATSTTGEIAPSGATPGSIWTAGDDATGLIAQSVGGGGGNAGINVTVSGAKPGDNNPVTAQFVIGGSGAGAGAGSTVDVHHAGNILTTGTQSRGLVAQSIGGGGGNANINLGLGYVKGASALNLSVGGATGAAGGAGAVTVSHSGVIATEGDDSDGLTAQSIGGGGGNTAMNTAMGLGSSRQLDIAIGRSGGTGGLGGSVTVTSAGTILTQGDRSRGIIAQSIGGGGGISGSIAVGAASVSGAGTSQRSYGGKLIVGLEGGSGAEASDVEVTSSSTILTAGAGSHAIHAQSLGGGGGVGGVAVNTLIGRSGALNLGVGGSGGSGNFAGRVDVISTGNLQTGGVAADGILAQSIGGGGGTGGYAATIGLQFLGAAKNGSSTLGVNVGGRGGNASDGGIVTVLNQGLISTLERRSYGIRAQSIGGGGGDGGMVFNGRIQGRGDNMDATFNVGGEGAGGGIGQDVTVTNEGAIYTGGDQSAGISANSIGGGGGDGGLLLNGDVGSTGSNNMSGRFTVNIGGSGGMGGVSGNVVVNNTPTAAADSGLIVTRGREAYGILAQSIAGGGGNGSSIISLTALGGDNDSAQLGLNVGGSGADASSAGTVTVNNGGRIDTSGFGAHGILAQSIGGGGGNGGLVFSGNAVLNARSIANAYSPFISVGGSGGDGGDANTVSVINTGHIVTRGAGAHGIVAQSIGGGGGSAQMGFGLSNNVASVAMSNSIAAIAGATGGGDGGLGGDVIVNHTGDITTLGEGSVGIKAESINGGGGSLGFDLTGITTLPGRPAVVDSVFGSDAFGGSPGGTAADPLIMVRLGSMDSGDMNPGSVTQTGNGTFGAAGDHSVAEMAQSIGGGGGTLTLAGVLGTEAVSAAPVAAQEQEGKLAAGPLPGIDLGLVLGSLNGTNNHGGSIESAHVGALLTNGVMSPALLLQSIGGGGGRGTIDVTAPSGASLNPIDLALGSVNGQGETGGDVTRTQTGSISTTGAFSSASLIQSIGGGGGVANVQIDAVDQSNLRARPNLGSRGGTDLGSGDIVSGLAGDVYTTGDAASGLVLQSIGAGGGDVRIAGIDRVGVTLGGQLDAHGDGGAVTLSHVGLVQTMGNRSHGVMLQSIGGGGGAVTTNASEIEYQLMSDNSGAGGNIRFTQTGNIITGGEGSFGIIAQSLGGGGGWVDGAFAGTAGGAGSGGEITLTVDGALLATGLGSTAVFAQSDGVDGAGNISIALLEFARGGRGLGQGAFIDGGANNTLLTTTSLSAVSTWAVRSTTGNDAVANTGLVVGNLDLGTGVNSFDNLAGSTFIAIDTIDLRDAPSETQLSTSDQIFDAAAELPVIPPADTAAEPVSVNGAEDQTNAADPIDGPLASGPSRPVVSDLSDAPAPALVSIDQVLGGAGPAAQPAAPNSLGVARAAASRPVSATLSAADVSGERRPLHAGLTASPQTGTAAPSVAEHPGDTKRPVQADLSEVSQPAMVSLASVDVSGGSKRPVQERSLSLPPTGPEFDPAPGTELAGKPGGVQVMAVLDLDDIPAPSEREQSALLASADPMNAATFRNSGTFLMGLSASDAPIDLLNGELFGNLDDRDDPATNLFYGVRVINTVELDGHFEQTADGHMVFDVAFGPYASDRVNVTGLTTVDGTGDITLIWLENTDRVTLFAAGEGGVDNGLSFRDTLAIDYSVAADAAGVHLLIDTDFGLASLNGNGRALGGHMDSALQAGGSAGLGRLLGFLGNLQNDQLDTYEAVFAELNPEPHTAVMRGQLTAANSFADDLFNCGSPVANGGDDCVWSRLEMTASSSDATVESLPTETQAMRFTGGFERRLGNDWSVAAGVSFEDTSPIRVDGQRAMTESQGFSVGLGFERNQATGPYYGGSVSGGWSWHETERVVTVFEAGVGTSTPESGYARIGGHIGDSFRNGSFFARPQVSASLTALHHDGLIEDGLDGLGVEVLSETELVAAINPQLTVGHIFRETEDMMGVVSLAAGARLMSQDSLELPMRFLGANPLAEPALIGTVLDDVVYQIGARIEIVGDERGSLSIGYDVEFGEQTEHRRAGIDFRVRF